MIAICRSLSIIFSIYHIQRRTSPYSSHTSGGISKPCLVHAIQYSSSFIHSSSLVNRSNIEPSEEFAATDGPSLLPVCTSKIAATIFLRCLKELNRV